MLPINKILIDSRFKTRASASSSDFKVELSETVMLREGVGACITEVHIPHTWYTIEESVNDRLYVRYVSEVSSQPVDKILSLSARNYDIQSLLAEIVLQLNTALGALFTGTLDATRGTISVHITSGWFQLPTDADLSSNTIYWEGPYYSKENLRSVNDLLKNTVSNGGFYNSTTPFVSGFIDVYTHHNIYITSSQLGSFQNIGPRGERNILKKVVVNAPYGEIITDAYANTDDYLDCSKHAIRVLDFRICDVYGNVLNLHGGHVSFSILFKLI